MAIWIAWSVGGGVLGQGLVITEFVADADDGLMDEDGELSDWIEIYNPELEEVSLAGWYLTDDAADLRQWQFGGGSIGARGFVVVYASGKDRRAPGANWHTNFRLEREGEYLALVRPDGVTRTSEYSPAFPPQLSGASYGLGMSEVRHELVGERGSARIRVPLGDGEGLGWSEALYDDSGWSPVQMGIGYERPEAGEGDPEPEVADVTMPGDMIYPTSYNSPGNEGVTLAIDDQTSTKYLNFDKLNAGLTVTPGVGMTVVVGLRVTSANDAPERDPVSFTLAGSNDGSQFTAIAQGPLPDFPARFHTVEVRFTNELAYRHYRLLFPDVRNAAAAVAVQMAEVELLGTVGVPAPDYQEHIGTDVEALMFQRSPSIQVRMPFEVPEGLQLNELLLRVRYDDGFAAFVNGQPVASANAPTTLSFNSVAQADRLRTEAVLPVAFGLSGMDGVLSPGIHVLAIQGLNDRADSPDFLLSAELVNERVAIGAAGYFATPTPGAVNAASSVGRVGEPQPNFSRGFYTNAMDVVLTSDTPGAQIRYTTDGSEPSSSVGTLYQGPIRVASSVPLRALAYREGWLESRVVTHSYLFVGQVAEQSETQAAQRGFPSVWGTTAADYGMDPRIVGSAGQDQYGGVYSRTLKDDLLALPSISLVMPIDDWFGAQGIYSNPENRGDAWEREVSFELIDPGAMGEGWQADAGIRIQGGAFRRFDLTKKKSFRIIFRSQYGAGMLEYPMFGETAAGAFNNFILRANSNDGWPYGGGNALYARDTFAMETARAMGMVASHTRFVHLYINGLYWGLYNPVERPDAAFSASYHGGLRSTWDALNQDGLVDGTVDAWNRMLSVLAEGMADPEVYQRIQGRNVDGTVNPVYENLLDVDNLIDYMMLNFYIGNGDWPGRNYWVGRDRAGTEGFQFYPWDSETALGLTGLNADRTGVDGSVARPYAAARENAEFRMRFADRVHRNFSKGGVFYVNPAEPEWNPAVPENNPSAARLAALASAIAGPMVGESARWGDQMGSGPYTRDGHWARARDSLLTDYFPRRSGIVLDQFRAAGLYPWTEAPTMAPEGGLVESGTLVTLSAPLGTIYYTTDGSDPRRPVEIEVISRHTLVSGASLKRVLVPTTGNGGSALGGGWRSVAGGFDDSGWRTGTGGVGYDTGAEYVPLIGIDVRDELFGKASSVYLRVPFMFDGVGLETMNTMTLRVRIDDGFVAYLNGTIIAAFNAPASPAWDSVASGANPDESAVLFRAFDVSQHVGALRAGENLLAIHAMNVSLGSSDFLVDAELEAGEQRQVGGNQLEGRYAGPIPITDLTTIRARALNGSEWSALTESTFAVGQPRLVATELNYHPSDPTPEEMAAGFVNDDDFEFIEFYNAGDGAMDLRGSRFVDGVEFDFNESTITRLGPGEYLLLVQNRAAFEFRYGNGLPVGGVYSGRFSNSGERVEVVDGGGATLIAFTYGTTDPWPASADGGGMTLTRVDLVGDPAVGTSWRASIQWGGTPGWGAPMDGLRIDYVRSEGDTVRLGFYGRAGREYVVRTREDWGDDWRDLEVVPSMGVDGVREVVLERLMSGSVFFQLREELE